MAAGYNIYDYKDKFGDCEYPSFNECQIHNNYKWDGNIYLKVTCMTCHPIFLKLVVNNSQL